MGECMSCLMSVSNGQGDTLENALKDLIRNIGPNLRNIQIHKKYGMVFTYDKVKFKNDIDIKQIDNVWHASTNLYLTTIYGEGKSDVESVINLSNEIKLQCSDVYSYPLYSLTCKNSRCNKIYTLPIIINKVNCVWHAYIY